MYDNFSDSAGTEVLTDWLDEPTNRSHAELSRRPLLAVLDTSCVRTGLHHQLQKGRPPASVRTVQDGSVKLFIEHETLVETCEKLPKFARDFGVPSGALCRMLNEDWLPYIRVVKLPHDLRKLDSRALEVRDLDRDDYAAAALAALLSPCILLTHNHKHFSPLGVRTPSQGVSAIIAAIDIEVGETQVQAVVMLSGAPVIGVAATTKWGADKIGPAAWVILGLIIVGGFYAFRQQSEERRERIKKAAGQVGRLVLEQVAEATAQVNQARHLLRACAIAGPDPRTPISAVFRELALASESLSAQQLAEELDYEVRPSVERIRAFLRANEDTAFAQVRRGGFELGRHYAINGG